MTGSLLVMLPDDSLNAYRTVKLTRWAGPWVILWEPDMPCVICHVADDCVGAWSDYNWGENWYDCLGSK